MAEEMNIQDMEQQDGTRVLAGLTAKDGGQKMAVTQEQLQQLDKDMFLVDGIIIRDEDSDTDLLFAPYEVEGVAGVGPEDMPQTDKRRKNALPDPSFQEKDGQEQTEWQRKNHEDVHASGCAICEAVKFGWLPSNGELTPLRDHVEDFNAIAEALGATPVGEDEYWSSTQYSDEYMWSLSMQEKKFRFWRSKTTRMKVRPVKSAAAYIEAVD